MLKYNRILFKSRVKFTYSFSTLSKKFTQTHEWISVDANGVGTLGITDYAQSALGDVVFVDLPAVNKKVEKSDSVGAVESVKAASDIYAPVKGTIAEVNTELENDPTLINSSPEDKGWIVKIKVEDKDELNGLLSKEQYDEHCKSQ